MTGVQTCALPISSPAADPWVELYVTGDGAASPTLVARDDDGGSGTDALLYRRTLAADGLYLVKAKSVSTLLTGTYELSAWLETGGARPTTGGTAREAEPNDTESSATDVSAAWRAVHYVASRPGEVTRGEFTEETLELRAGDVVTVWVRADPGSVLDPATSLVDESGKNVLAVDRGDTNRGAPPADEAHIVAFAVPGTGSYHLRVWGSGSTVGSYDGKVYLSRDEAAVVGRHVFYNNSVYDGRTADAGAADDGAVPPDKVALLPGRAATLANLTNFSAGINGIMIDVKGLRDDVGEADFAFAASTPGTTNQWDDAPAPASIARRAGAGPGGSDRITLTWRDGSIVNRWLRVTLKASESNGLVADDVFCFGNLVGETADDPAAAAVTPADVLRTRRRLSRTTSLTDWFDFNRDGRVNAADQALVRSHVSRNLPMGEFPVTSTAASREGQFVALRRDHPTRRPSYEAVTTMLH